MGEGDLTKERALLARDGQVIVRGLLEPGEVARFRGLVNAALPTAVKVQLPPGNEVYQAAFDQYMNLWQTDPAMAELTLHPGLARTAAVLLGADAVRVYHDQALYKVAGGGHTPWHQDQWYWPLDTDRTITMWLPLHDVDADMGDLEFALGTHRGPIGDEAISGESDAFYESYLADADINRRTTGSMTAGDASFHLGWTLHRANPNVTDTDREVMTVIWFADGARVAEPANQGQQLDRLIWLRNLEPGELAASSLNPLVGVS
ncbi:MAG TPA: phytanoyl-CoA dioxygenase family protein [Ilumatobacteraceae bacterium]|nr:phytanoyl-CoA dioxygenase family protein [Ilumatobacteraceae bacterium]